MTELKWLSVTRSITYATLDHYTVFVDDKLFFVEMTVHKNGESVYSDKFYKTNVKKVQEEAVMFVHFLRSQE